MTALFELTGTRVFVAGHSGIVGAAMVRGLAVERCTVITAPRQETDLRDRSAVDRLFATQRLDVVVLAAAKVDGSRANDNAPADFSIGRAEASVSRPLRHLPAHGAAADLGGRPPHRSA